MKVRLVAAVIGTAAVLTAGCSSSGEGQATAIASADTAVATATPGSGQPSVPPATYTVAATATPTPVRVVESGFTSYTDSTGAIIGAWAAVIQNPDINRPASDTNVTAIFYGSDNVVLKTEQQTVSLILAGQMGAAGSSYVSLTAKPTRLEIRVAGTKFINPLPSPVEFKISDVTYVASSFSGSVNAKVSNPLTKDVSNLSVTCMMVAPDGTYPAIGTAYVDLIPAGATAVATCRLDSRMTIPAGSTARMFTRFGNITTIAQ